MLAEGESLDDLSKPTCFVNAKHRDKVLKGEQSFYSRNPCVASKPFLNESRFL
jgi:hypothetical protein